MSKNLNMKILQLATSNVVIFYSSILSCPSILYQSYYIIINYKAGVLTINVDIGILKLFISYVL